MVVLMLSVGGVPSPNVYVAFRRLRRSWFENRQLRSCDWKNVHREQDRTYNEQQLIVI